MIKTRTTTAILKLLALAILLGFGPAGQAVAQGMLSAYNLEERPPYLWQFPKQFKEMSGLALSSDGRLFGHAEKRAIIYLIDWREGALLKTFYFGRPPVKGDFEGLAIAAARFYLITEKGMLYEGREGFEGESKLFREHDTGLAKVCEVEGLATYLEAGKLLILCRKAREKGLKGKLTIFSWDIASGERDEAPFLQVDLMDTSIPEEVRKAEPSGLEVLPDGSGLMVLTTGKRWLIEISFEGEIRKFSALHDKRHKNPEGLAITPEGDLIIADEAGTLQMTVYPKGETSNAEDGSVDNAEHDDEG